MTQTTLYLTNGQTRTVRGSADEIGIALKRRTLGDDDRIRQFRTTDGDTIVINADAIWMAETAETPSTGTFGFARALEAA